MTTTLIPPGTVVVGIDGSTSAERALDWAVDHAVREHRQLTLVHAATPEGIGPAYVLVDDGRHLLAEACERVRRQAPDLAVHQAVWAADPRTVLVRLASDASLVVVGSHGRGPVASVVLGSVGVALVRHAACPVVVVRPGHAGRVRHGVAVATDGTQRSRAVVELAYRHASLRRLPLTIQHGLGDEAELRASEALAGLAEKFPDVRARLEPVGGPAARALATASERMDLVVVEAEEAVGVVEHATCPVLVYPAGSSGSATSPST